MACIACIDFGRKRIPLGTFICHPFVTFVVPARGTRPAHLRRIA